MVVGGSEATRRLLNGQKLEKRLKKEKERKGKEKRILITSNSSNGHKLEISVFKIPKNKK